jgi:LAO/AO transport system kinase
MPPAERRPLSTEEFVDGILASDRAVLGRAITLIESHRREHMEQAQEVLGAIQDLRGETFRVGISGVPGVGKSTFIESFGLSLVEEGHRVAVLAVDPSSSITGGSILGDKTRMPELSRRDAAFIRPSPTSGSLGGVGRKTRETLTVCEAAGFGVVLIETVGVGQSETLVAEMVDFFLVLMLAGAGDELQGIKRGIIELADLLAINKADGEGAAAADRARTELERALAILRPAASATWTPRVLTCSARYGDGLDEIWLAVQEHHRRLTASGELEDRRRSQQVRWMWAMVDDVVHRAIRDDRRLADHIPRLEEAVRTGSLGPTSAAAEILERFGVRRS